VIRAEGNLGVFSSQEESFDDQESTIKQIFSVQPVNEKHAKTRKLTKISLGGIWSDD
jgi:hypothetical protein